MGWVSHPQHPSSVELVPLDGTQSTLDATASGRAETAVGFLDLGLRKATSEDCERLRRGIVEALEGLGSRSSESSAVVPWCLGVAE